MTAITLRHVGAGDARLIFDWRNDPATRAVSRDTGELSWPDHAAWFERRLDKTGAPWWIGEAGGRPIGFVRLDPAGGDAMEVSIALAPEARGQGLGAPLLDAGLAAAGENGIRGVTAVIRPDNTPSRRIFARCGFVELGEADGLVRLSRDLTGTPSGAGGDRAV